ncbi:MAG: Ig-like domain-containing protein [Coriobacteriales bacterium]|jgi:hypothetical protein|nr:Ig-like domain-containing protein [Coriobacteriales bacterium]
MRENPSGRKNSFTKENHLGRKALCLALALVLACGMLVSTPRLREASAEDLAPLAAGESSLVVNETVIGFAGYEWYVIGYDGTGVYSTADDNSMTLWMKTLDTPFGSTAWRALSTEPAEGYSPYEGWYDPPGSVPSILDTWYYADNPAGFAAWSAPWEYAGSTLQQRMEEIAAGLDAKESQLINARTIQSDPFSDTFPTVTPDLANQKLWPLSLREYQALGSGGTTVGYYRVPGINNYWLRSAGKYTTVVTNYENKAVACFPSGGTSTYAASAFDVNGAFAIRPALSLDLSSVLFISAASAKSSTEVGGTLQAASSGAQKLTVTDDATQKLQYVYAAQAEQDVSTSGALSFGFTGATTGEGQYVSCILQKKDAPLNLSYYGKLASTADKSYGTLSIPLAGIADGNYTLKIFSEKVNDDAFTTDFASTPVTMDLSVAAGRALVIGGTVDNVQPQASVVWSRDGITGNDTVSVNFGEEMDTASAPNLTLSSLRDSTPTTLTGGTWSADGKSYTCTTSELALETRYSVDFDLTAFTDLVGNTVMDETPYSFDTSPQTGYALNWQAASGCTITQTAIRAELGDTVNFSVATLTGTPPLVTATYTVFDANGKKSFGAVNINNLGGGNYSFVMPKGDVEIYAYVLEASSIPLIVEPGEHMSARLDSLYARQGSTVALTTADSQDYHLIQAQLWAAEQNADGSYTATGSDPLATIALDGVSVGHFTVPSLSAPATALIVRLIDTAKPRNSVAFPASLTLNGATVTIAPRDTTGWQQANGSWTTQNYRDGQHASLALVVQERNYSVNVDEVSLLGAPLSHASSSTNVGGTATTMLSFTMPAFTDTASWTGGSITIALSAQRIPAEMSATSAVAVPGAWWSAARILVKGSGLEQVKGEGLDFPAFDSAKQAQLKTVTLQNGSKTATFAPGDITLNPDGTLSIALSEAFKQAFGEPASDLFYLSVGNRNLPLYISRDYRVRAEPFGIIGVATDGSNNYSVVVGDSAADLERRATYEGKTLLLRVVGEVTRNASGVYTFSQGSVLLHNIITFTIGAGGHFRVSEGSGSVSLSAAGGRASFPGLSVSTTKFDATLQAGTRYSMTDYADPDNNPNFSNVAFELMSDAIGMPAGLGLNAKVNGFKLLDGKVIFGGKLNLSIMNIAEDALNIDIERLQYSMENGSLKRDGAEASGRIALAGDDTGFLNYVSVAAGNNYYVKVNTFPGEERYTVDLNGSYGVVEGRILVDLIRSERAGRLVPNAIGMEGYGETGIDLVPPRLLTLKGGGFYLYGLAETIDWPNFQLAPPLSIAIKGRLGVVEVVDVDTTLRLGARSIGVDFDTSVAGTGKFDFLSFSPASASLDVSWPNAADPKNLTYVAASLKGEYSIPAYWFIVQRYSGGIDFAINKGKAPTFAGYFAGSYYIPGFKVPIVKWNVGGWELLGYGVYVSSSEMYTTANLLGKTLRLKVGVVYKPFDPYASIGYKVWFFGNHEGEINLFSEDASVGDSLAADVPYVGENGEQLGTISIGDGWRLVGRYGVAGAESSLSPLGSDTVVTLDVEPQAPEASYELAPITGTGGYQNIIGIDGLTRDNLELLYDKDGDTTTADWTPYPLIWERDGAVTEDKPLTGAEMQNPLANAMDFSAGTFTNSETGTTEPGSILLKLDAGISPYWMVRSADGATTFTCSQVQTDPLPSVTNAAFDSSAQTLTVSTDGLVNPAGGSLDPARYSIDVQMVPAGDGTGAGSASGAAAGEGVTAVTLASDIAVTNTDPLTIDLASALAALPVNLPTGDYQMTAVLKEKDLAGEKQEVVTGYTEDGAEITELQHVAVPIDTVTAAQTFSYVNTNIPAAVASATATPIGNGALELAWDAVRDPATDTASDYIDYEVRALDANGNPMYAAASEGAADAAAAATTAEEGEGLGDPAGEAIEVVDQQPLTWLFSHEDAAADGGTALSLSLGGLTPGETYRFEITPVRSLDTSTGAAMLRGDAYTSAPVFVPLPEPAAIALSFGGAREDLDEISGESVVHANSDYTLGVSFDRDVSYELRYSDGEVSNSVMASGTAAAGEVVEVTVAGSTEHPVNLITVKATTAAGDESYRSFTSYYSNQKPTMFVETDAEGTVYADQDGNFSLTGQTVAGYVIQVVTGEATELVANADGAFRFDGNMSKLPLGEQSGAGSSASAAPAADEVRWISLSVYDASGNTDTQTVKVMVGPTTTPPSGPWVPSVPGAPSSPSAPSYGGSRGGSTYGFNSAVDDFLALPPATGSGATAGSGSGGLGGSGAGTVDQPDDAVALAPLPADNSFALYVLFAAIALGLLSAFLAARYRRRAKGA